MKGPEGIGEIIRRYGFTRGVGKGATALIREHWADIVGENLALHCRPGRIKRKTLEIACDGSAWASEIAVREREILRALEKAVGGGTVQRIRFVNRGSGEGPVRECPGGMKGITYTRPQSENHRAGASREEVSRPAESAEELEKALSRLIKSSSSGKQCRQNR